jgi:hypothetical protein
VGRRRDRDRRDLRTGPHLRRHATIADGAARTAVSADQSAGFSTAGLASGLAGSVAGIPVYVSNGMAANTILVLSSAAAEVYEDRIGSLQVVEPSVLGVQVAYAGYFASLVLEATGLSKIVKTP